MSIKGSSQKQINIFFTRQNDDVRKIMWNEAVERRIHELGWNISFNEKGELSEQDLADELEGIDALITTWGAPRLTETALSKADSLQIVGHAAGSVAFTVSDALWDHGVTVTTANSLMAEIVAEYNVMMTIAGLRKVMDYMRCGDTTKWDTFAKIKHITAPCNAIIGIWGYGDVAKNLIKLLKPFKPKELLVCDDYLSEEEAKKLGIRKVDLMELFEQSDVVHLAQGLIPETVARIGRKELSALKDGAILINSARAHLIDTDALYQELETGRFCAILDVLPEEPLSKSSPLHKYKKVFFTPHTASFGAEHLFVPLIIDEFERFFRGEPLEHEITRERAKHMTQLTPEKVRS